MAIWNMHARRGRRVTFFPTIGTALAANTPILEVLCPACQTLGEVDIRKLGRHPDASLTSLIPSLSCRMCRLVRTRRRPSTMRWKLHSSRATRAPAIVTLLPDRKAAPRIRHGEIVLPPFLYLGPSGARKILCHEQSKLVPGEVHRISLESIWLRVSHVPYFVSGSDSTLRTSFHYQPETQHPKSSAIHKLPADYPILGRKRPHIDLTYNRMPQERSRVANAGDVLRRTSTKRMATALSVRFLTVIRSTAIRRTGKWIGNIFKRVL